LSKYADNRYSKCMASLEIIQTYLQKLGIEAEATKIYLELTKAGPTSALQLAKQTAISRTQVYRHLERLQAAGLASAEQLSYGTLHRALPLENIEGLLANREAETAAIRRNLGAMTAALQALAGSGGPKATVQHYYGQAGLKQVNWNLTKAQGEFRVFEAAHLSQHLDRAFARRCREQCIMKGLRTFDLTNDDVALWKDLEPVDPKLSQLRHIDRSVLEINFEVFIYNQVVTLVDYGRGHELAIEIHHPSLQQMMRQLFDAMWAQGTPLAITK